MDFEQLLGSGPSGDPSTPSAGPSGSDDGLALGLPDLDLGLGDLAAPGIGWLTDANDADAVRDLTPAQRARLAAVCARSFANGFRAISAFLDDEHAFTVATPGFLPFDQFVAQYADELSVAYVSVIGDVEGHLALVFRRTDVPRVLDPILRVLPGADGLITSGIGEIGNLFGSRFMSGMLKDLGLSCVISPPTPIDGDAATVFSLVAADVGNGFGEVLAAPVEALCGGEPALVHVAFFPSAFALAPLARALDQQPPNA